MCFLFLHYDRYDTEKELGECSALHRVNRLLKEIGEELGLPFPLTTYVARHTWASLAEECGIATGITVRDGSTAPNIPPVFICGECRPG